jgi:REP element-mobilizing transposase RayT
MAIPAGQIEEGHLLADPVHIMISIPPKSTVAQMAGVIRRVL